ncbi:MAG TPA: NUDIX domain-containing protein [Candidatus Angelobacter sp.]
MKVRLKRLTRTTGVQQFTRPTTMQVAALCYRQTGFSVEFLLVNTSAGKWTFPKGRIAPEMSLCEAAEQEALEEAGAIGTIEESCLGHYTDLKRALGHDNRSREILIAAYLLKVATMSVPHEPGRNPTWFTSGQAKQRLSEQRAAKYFHEIARIVDAAEMIIQRSALAPGRTATYGIYREDDFGRDSENLDSID